VPLLLFVLFPARSDVRCFRAGIGTVAAPELQGKLRIVREAIKDAEDKRLGLGKYVKVDKVEETRAEAAAKAAAAEKALQEADAAAAAAEAGGDAAPMETETAAPAEPPAVAAAAPEEGSGEMEVEGDAAAAAATDEKEPAELVKELTAFEDPEMPENKTGWYLLPLFFFHLPSSLSVHPLIRPKEGDGANV
jgi:hypothetical protein